MALVEPVAGASGSMPTHRVVSGPAVASAPALRSLDLDEWQAWVEAHPGATIFHHRSWLELLIEQYALRLHILAVREGQRTMAAIPFLQTRTLSGTKKLIALPFSDCVSALASDADSMHLLREGLRAQAFDGFCSVFAKTDAPLGGFPVSATWVRHELCTGRPVEEIVAGFVPSLRRALRKAARSQLGFDRRTDIQAVETFYRLHASTRRRLGLPVQPKSFFRRLHRRLLEAGHGFVGVVTRHGRPLAAGVFLTYKRTMIYKYGASRRDALEHRPNEWLFENVIRLAREGGYARLDLGASRLRDEGLRRFKRKWGARETPLYHEWYAGRPRTGIEDSALARIVATTLPRAPVFVCRALGEVLYRYSQ